LEELDVVACAGIALSSAGSGSSRRRRQFVSRKGSQWGEKRLAVLFDYFFQ
jgi:hypothetical protein